MNDKTNTVAELRELVAEFVQQRDWSEFHTPKNLASCIAIETAELMEHYQWLTPEQSFAAIQDAGTRQAVAEELADVLAYVLAFANATGIDLADSLQRKMQKNALKYPPPSTDDSSAES